MWPPLIPPKGEVEDVLMNIISKLFHHLIKLITFLNVKCKISNVKCKSGILEMKLSKSHVQKFAIIKKT